MTVKHNPLKEVQRATLFTALRNIDDRYNYKIVFKNPKISKSISIRPSYFDTITVTLPFLPGSTEAAIDLYQRNHSKIQKALKYISETSQQYVYIPGYSPAQIKMLKEKTLRDLVPLVQRYAKKIGCEFNQIKVKAIKSRWGSCSDRKNLNFSVMCGLLPPRLQEYIVIHEVCHLKYLDHSENFYNLCISLCDDFMERDREISQTNTDLSKKIFGYYQKLDLDPNWQENH